MNTTLLALILGVCTGALLGILYILYLHRRDSRKPVRVENKVNVSTEWDKPAEQPVVWFQQPAPPIPASVGSDERMYADSGHQVVNPAVMKQVLNDHFGELNPEPSQWDADTVAMLLMDAGVRTLRSDGDKAYIEVTACEAIAKRLNDLTP